MHDIINRMIKALFFKCAHYSNPLKYEKKYNNELCERENKAIQSILKACIDEHLVITDVGCGTGLGRSMIHNTYVGIDQSKKAIEYCNQNYAGYFIHIDAKSYIEEVNKVNPIFLFSIDYLDPETIQQYIDKTEKVMIAVHYHKPYLSPSSIYKGREWLFNKVHPLEKQVAIERIFKQNYAMTFRLLEQDYYYVTILKKRGEKKWHT